MSDVPNPNPQPTVLVAYGQTIKALAGDRFGGYLVVWGSPDQRDLQGEYFTRETDLGLDYDGTLRAFFHHGLDGTMGTKSVGVIDTLRSDDIGLWAEGVLNMRDKYVKKIKELVQRGALSWSSGSLPHMVKIASDGHILRWPIVEGSLTPSPAEPRQTDISPLKSVFSLTELEGLTAKAIPDWGETNEANLPTQPIKTTEDYTMPDLQVILKALVDAGLLPPMDDQQMAAAVAMLQEKLQATAPAEAEPEAAMSAENVQAQFAKADFLKEVVQGVKAIVGEKDVTASIIANAAAALKAQVGTGGVSRATGVQRPGKSPQIQVMSKYRNLSAEDMSYIYFARNQMSMKQYGTAWQPEPEFMGELYTKAYKGLTNGDLHFDDPTIEARAIKTMDSALKANELDHSTQAGFGDEWVPDLWSSQIWDRVRLDNLIAPLFQVIEMPSNPFEYPLESTDPTVYFVPETTAETELTLDSSSSVIPDSKFATGKVQLNAKKLALRAGYSMELDEDSIISIAAQSRKQAVRAIENAIDHLLLNGDDSASGNINLDGGTPGATQIYMAFEGLRHVPIIDTTANAVDMGGVDPTLAKIRQTRFTLAAPKAGRPQDLYYVTHTEVLAKLLSMSEFITVDKYGPNATVMTGELGKIDGSPVIITGELGLTASNGKISNTGGNNTLGSLLVGHRGSRVVGYRRRVTPKLVYLDYYDAYQLVVTVRIAFAKQDADSEGVLYNIKIT